MTILTTVGLGDSVGVSSFERLYSSFNMLFGVAVYSLIGESFFQMLERVKSFN